MGNTAGKAYGMTLLCPIRQDDATHSYSNLTRNRLERLPLHSDSPMAKVPNTYLCRFYLLDDVFYEGSPAQEEHLQSRYLVFCTNFHGDRDAYLRGMWDNAQAEVKQIWEYCVAFDKVKTAEDFVGYAQKCQVTNSLFFKGSTDDPLAEQLKALYLKQEFTRFAFDHYGKSAAELQQAFREFVSIVKPDDLSGPTWQPGMTEETPQHCYSFHMKGGKA